MQLGFSLTDGLTEWRFPWGGYLQPWRCCHWLSCMRSNLKALRRPAGEVIMFQGSLDCHSCFHTGQFYPLFISGTIPKYEMLASPKMFVVAVGRGCIPNGILVKEHNLWLNTYCCSKEKNIDGELPERSSLSIVLITYKFNFVSIQIIRVENLDHIRGFPYRTAFINNHGFNPFSTPILNIHFSVVCLKFYKRQNCYGNEL